ncbi:MAG: hypothetical protein L6N96_00310 [Candidatus Methylarchaceae archaeon HK02M2]|nr:hypothetical protein [Candidatus Methylarchaceae archaeon HK02M2]
MGYYTNYNYYPGAGNPDQGTTTTEFNIDPSWIGSSMTVEVVVEETWEVEIETSTLTIQQAHVETEKDFRYTNVNFTPYDAGPDGILGTEDDVQLSAELGDLLLQDEDGNYLVDVVVHKNGWVKSTNPGQLYGVITITPVQSVEMVSVSDVFGDFFDVNPAQLGGGVEVILIEDSTQLATILTYEDWVTCDVDNEAGEVDIDIDFTQSTDGSLDPGDTLMIYIKFQTAMKHEDWSGPDSFTNEAIITADDQEFTNSATILLSEKE